ncbi:hypothetical protein F2Q69_00035985 [Brassica cretica]|uniref:Uncharacterized protein n=1 Tax=Brassica cretica TaxID=69181 RepID=A0A8S9SKA1_BRACR|nr:hypothetical protein F2Q69_00035985 [Brassica cretica]
MISIRSITRVKEKSCNLGTSSVDGLRNPRRQDHPACNAASIFSSSTAQPPLICTFDLILPDGEFQIYEEESDEGLYSIDDNDGEEEEDDDDDDA